MLGLYEIFISVAQRLATSILLFFFFIQNSSLSLAAATPLIKIPISRDGQAIGFDDIQYSPSLKSVLLSSGRVGEIALINQESHLLTFIRGFSQKQASGVGHNFGVTSLDEGSGRIVTVDRTSRKLFILDSRGFKILASTTLQGEPDYVRYIAASNEVWITEPGSEQIEVFQLSETAKVVVKLLFLIPVEGGPESLLIDPTKGLAYTHLWQGKTVAISLKSHKIVSTWHNGCVGSRGIALDSIHDILLVGCVEGIITTFKASTGVRLSEAKVGKGVDIIDFNIRLRHLYVPSAETGELAILSVSMVGQLSLLSTVVAEKAVHCVTSDHGGGIYVCDPKHGSVLFLKDSFPPN